MSLLALVDYDNVAIEKELGPDDVERNLNTIAENLIRLCAAAKLQTDRELRIRLYGGWISEQGRYTPRAEMLLARIGSIRGLRMGTRVIPSLVTSTLNCEEYRLIGSSRSQRDFSSQTTRQVQKMVDTMLAVDVLLQSELPDAKYVVVCDDDDLIPALLAAQRRPSPPLRVFRRRELGQGLNDEILQSAGCRVNQFFK